MSELAASPALQPDADEPLQRPVVPRSWLARAMLDTFGKTSARIGLAWIGVVGICGRVRAVPGEQLPDPHQAERPLVQPAARST